MEKERNVEKKTVVLIEIMIPLSVPFFFSWTDKLF